MKATAFEMTIPLPRDKKLSNTVVDPVGLSGDWLRLSEVEPSRPGSIWAPSASGSSDSAAAKGLSS